MSGEQENSVESDAKSPSGQVSKTKFCYNFYHNVSNVFKTLIITCLHVEKLPQS